MNSVLEMMHLKIETMKHGLLRIKEGSGHFGVQVSTSVYNGQHMHCIFKENETSTPLLNRDVVLIQKNGNNYFYISGLVEEEDQNSFKEVSLKIKTACWFIRRKKGNIVWMEQKCVFEAPLKKIS